MEVQFVLFKRNDLHILIHPCAPVMALFAFISEWLLSNNYGVSFRAEMFPRTA